MQWWRGPRRQNQSSVSFSLCLRKVVGEIRGVPAKETGLEFLKSLKAGSKGNCKSSSGKAGKRRRKTHSLFKSRCVVGAGKRAKEGSLGDNLFHLPWNLQCAKL